MNELLPQSPLDIECRYCSAPPTEKCTTKPSDRGPGYVRVLDYFHGPRWRDFNRMRGERQAMDEWNQKYGSVHP